MGMPDDTVKSVQKAAIEDLESSGGLEPARMEGWFKETLEKLEVIEQKSSVTISPKRRSTLKYWDLSTVHITAQDRIKIQQEGPFNLARHDCGAFYWVDDCAREEADQNLEDFGMSGAFRAIYRKAAQEGYDGIQFDCDGAVCADLDQFEDHEPGYPFSRVSGRDYPLGVSVRLIWRLKPDGDVFFENRTLWYYLEEIKEEKRGLFLVQLEQAIKKFYHWAEGGYPLDC